MLLKIEHLFGVLGLKSLLPGSIRWRERYYVTKNRTSFWRIRVDEPTTGLDPPIAREAVCDIVR